LGAIAGNTVSVNTTLGGFAMMSIVLVATPPTTLLICSSAKSSRIVAQRSVMSVPSASSSCAIRYSQTRSGPPTTGWLMRSTFKNAAKGAAGESNGIVTSA